MTKTIVFNTLGYEDAIDQSFMEAEEQAEAEAEERSLKWVRDVIENPEYRERASKVSKEVLAKQAKMLEQGRNPAGYYDDDDYDDDDYDADEWYLDDECYPDDE